MPNILKLSLEDLTFLFELKKTGILLKAGAGLNMSPSTSSRNFARICSAFPSPIFRYESGKWSPTEYFYSIEPHLADMLESARLLVLQAFDPMRSERTYTFTSVMAEVDIVIQGVLPKLMARSPKARLDLSKYESEFTAVVKGLVDFAIVTNANLPADVHTMKLYPTDRVILVRKGHPLTRRQSPITVESLAPYDRVTIRNGRSASWTGPESSLFPYETFLEHTRYSTSRFNTAWGAMARTDLIGVCGWRAAEIAMRSYELTALPLPIDFEEQDLWTVLIWSDQKHKDPSLIWLRSLFKEWAAEEEERVRRLTARGMGPPSYKSMAGKEQPSSEE